MGIVALRNGWMLVAAVVWEETGVGNTLHNMSISSQGPLVVYCTYDGCRNDVVDVNVDVDIHVDDCEGLIIPGIVELMTKIEPTALEHSFSGR